VYLHNILTSNLFFKVAVLQYFFAELLFVFEILYTEKDMVWMCIEIKIVWYPYLSNSVNTMVCVQTNKKWALLSINERHVI